MTDLSDWGPSGAAQADAGMVPARPRLSIVDLILHLWRAKWLMLLVALPILGLGLLLASQMPEKFESRSALYVSSDAVLMPGAKGSDLVILIQGEVQILQTQLVAERTLARFPLSRLYPALAEARDKRLAAAPATQHDAIEFAYFQKGVEALRAEFRAQAMTNSNTILVSFKHPDRHVASEILNAAMAVYLQRRTELFGRTASHDSKPQRKDLEAALLAADAAIDKFMKDHSIRDFVSERATNQSLYTAISNELFAVQARGSAVQGQLSRTREQLAETEPEHEIYIEDSSAERLRALEIERTQALVTFTPTSRRVQAIERQIAEIRAFLASNDGPIGTSRRGPNPTYQALLGARNTFDAEAESLRQKQIELRRQLQAVEDRLKRFSDLQPAWNELQRTRDLSESDLRDFTDRTQRQGSDIARSQRDREAIRITEPATVPTRSSSLKWPLAALAFMLAGLAGLLVGGLRALTRTGFATPSSLQRTLGLPVLGTVRHV